MSNEKKVNRKSYDKYLNSEPAIKAKLDNFNLLLKDGDINDAENAGFVPIDNTDIDKLDWDLGNDACSNKGLE